MNITTSKKQQQVVKRSRTKKRWSLDRFKVRKDIHVGDIVEGCDLHIGLVTEVNTENGDVVSTSLFTNKTGSCDLYHCGVIRQTDKQVRQKLALYKDGGIPAIKKLWDERVRKGTY